MAARKTTKNTKANTIDKKFTTSKMIVLVSYIIGVVLTALTVLGICGGYDVSVMGIITTAAYAEIAASNAFYFWKAKKENVMKIALAVVQDTPTEKVDDAVKLINSMGGIV